MKKQPVLAYDRTTKKLLQWPSCREAERDGFNRRTIWMVARGRRRSHRGMAFFYIT